MMRPILHSSPRVIRRAALGLLVLASFIPLACGEDAPTAPPPAERPFLEGTEGDPQIGLVVASLARTLTLFQLGDPAEQRTMELGASSSVTPVSLAVHGKRALVPLGNAASVALIDLEARAVERFFLFPSGNASGAVFVDDGTALVSNLVTDQVGRVSFDQPDNEIRQLVDVAPAPVDVILTAGKAFVVSGNLGDDFTPRGNGVVTVLDPVTLDLRGTVDTGGTNPQFGAVAPNGLLYVVNTGDFVTPGSMAVIDPVTERRVGLVQNLGVGPGSISVDDAGLAYVSGFFFGTLVYDTGGERFVRGPDEPVCAPLAAGGCRGAMHARADRRGRLYQAFFGSPAEGLAPFTFVYEAGTFVLADSIPTGEGPTALAIEVFRE